MPPTPGFIAAPNLDFDWLTHGFGLRGSTIPDGLTTVRQIHSDLVLDACGRVGEQIGEGDAIISGKPGVAIAIRTADCVPILIADSRTRMTACVHAGWRGTARNIVATVVERLAAEGCRPSDLSVAIGPSIGSCCYPVSADVARQFEAWLGKPGLGKRDFADGDRPDLPAINRIQLQNAGVREIWTSGECTFCNPERFYSFRREKENAGRMLSFIGRAV